MVRSSARQSLDLFLGDLMRALEQDEGQKLGGKSAEAARFILRAIDRELDRGRPTAQVATAPSKARAPLRTFRDDAPTPAAIHWRP